MNRPQFQRLLEDIRLGRINLVLATELSRLSRSIRDFCELWDLFKKHDAKIITLREQFDTTSAAGEMMVFNLINFAQFERKQTGERISANFLSRAKRGLWNGGAIPLGYDRDPVKKGTLVVNPVEAERIRTLFKTFLETGSLRRTCLNLNKDGLRTKAFKNKAGNQRGGNHFTHSALYHTLRNQTYIGMIEIGKKLGRGEFVEASWPKIIDKPTFQAVQKILEQNKCRFKPDEWKTYPYPLTDKIVCGECGKKMGGKSAHGHNGKHYYYEHGRKISKDGIKFLNRCRLERVRAPRMETMTLGFLKKLLGNPEMIDQMLKAYYKQTNTELPGLEGRLKSIEAEIKQNEMKTENLIARLSELPQEVSAEPIYAQLKLFGEKTTFLKDSRVQLQSQTHRITTQGIDKEGLRDRIKTAVDALEHAPVEKQRAIFSNIIDFAELHPLKVRLGIYAPLAALASSRTVQNGGEGEIRTPGTLASSTVFKTAAFDRSATSPFRTIPYYGSDWNARFHMLSFIVNGRHPEF